MKPLIVQILAIVGASAALPCHAADPAPLMAPTLIGHRGLIHEAPENTLAAFAACIELRIGFELDIRRSRDGRLVIMHDPTVDRTTDGTGKVAELTLAELKKLDAGRKFDPAFAGQRVPSLEEVFALLRDHKVKDVLVAVDLKIDDDTVAADMVKLANKHEVLGQLIFIGLTIDEPAVRKKLRAADAKAPAAVLAQTEEGLQAAIDDADASWVYMRFVPSAEQVAKIRKANKRVFLSGPPVNGNQPDNWKRAREVGADALLTDFPLECRRGWREVK